MLCYTTRIVIIIVIMIIITIMTIIIIIMTSQADEAMPERRVPCHNAPAREEVVGWQGETLSAQAVLCSHAAMQPPWLFHAAIAGRLGR